MNTGLFKLGWQDFAKGALVSVVTAVLGTLGTSLSSGHVPTGAEWKSIGLLALSSLVAYLGKNFITNSDGTIGGKEVK